MPTLASLLTLILLAPAAQSGGLAGTWSLDAEESDDVSKIMEEAMRRAEERGGRGRRAGGGFGGRAGRRGGGGGPGGPAGMASQPESLEIEVEAREVRIHAGEDLQILYLDGEEHLRQDRRGNSIRTEAEIAGGILSVTEKRESPMGDLKIFRTIQASEDALVIRTEIDPPRGQTINIRSVYRRD